MLKRVDNQLLFRCVWALVVLVWNATDINGSTTHVVLGVALEVVIGLYLVYALVEIVKQIRNPDRKRAPVPAPARPGSATSWVTPETILVLIVVFVVVFYLARVAAPS